MKVSQHKRLQKLYQRRIPAHALVSPEFAHFMAGISAEIRRQVGVLVTRRGEVEYVIVGDRGGIQLPDFKRIRTGFRRFRGLRCIHTHLGPEGLNRDDLTDLSLIRLDTMTAVEVTDDGRAGNLHTAHLVPDYQTGKAVSLSNIWKVLPAVDVHRLDLDFQSFIRDLESEFVRKMPEHWQQMQGERAMLIGVTTGPVDGEQDRMSELAELAISADVTILDSFVQRRSKLDNRFLMGRGKLQELIIRSMQLGVTLLIFNQNLNPTQIRNICRETDLKVIDRTQLILDIFARRAQSLEGKIQVELAQLKYLMPRLVEFDDSLSRLTGGIGGRGPGETTLEVNRRRLKDKISLLEKRLESISRSRRQRRQRRQRRDVPVVSIVGYTNAGKSTLLNNLTLSEVLVEDKMFATLDPVSRRLRLPWNQEILLSDTVGFIRDLPPELMEAFKATLEEIDDSQLLIHLVDAANPFRERQIESVERILKELQLDDIPRCLVFNKFDLIEPDERDFLEGRYQAMGISALKREGLDVLQDRIRQYFDHPSSTMSAEPTSARSNSQWP